MKSPEFRQALRELGLSQAAFARLLSEHAEGTEVSLNTVGRWCQGRRAVPPAAALAVSLLLQAKRMASGRAAE